MIIRIEVDHEDQAYQLMDMIDYLEVDFSYNVDIVHDGEDYDLDYETPLTLADI